MAKIIRLNIPLFILMWLLLEEINRKKKRLFSYDYIYGILIRTESGIHIYRSKNIFLPFHKNMDIYIYGKLSPTHYSYTSIYL